jgi:hypothetical protein
MRWWTMAALLLGPALASAQTPPAGMSAIREADLRRDLYIIAGDAFRGREGGSPDELAASVWVAEELRKIGLEPMGDHGSFFQWWDIRRTRVGASSMVRIGDRQFAMWDDIAVASNNTSRLHCPHGLGWRWSGHEHRRARQSGHRPTATAPTLAA